MYNNSSNIDFKNIHTFEDGENKVFSFRFGNTVYEEVFSKGRYMSAGWNTAGYTLNVLDGINTRLDTDLFCSPQAFEVEVNGTTLSYDWIYESFETEKELLENGEEVLRGILTLSNKLISVKAKIHTILDGTSVMTRYIEAVNDCDEPIGINTLAPMCGAMELMENPFDYISSKDPSKIYTLGYFESAGWGHEGLFKWHDLPNARYGICGGYKDDTFRHPMFALKNNAIGTMFFCQLGWVGGYEINFDLKVDMDKTRETFSSRLEFSVDLDANRPMVVLNKGEAYTSPAVHITVLNGSLDDAINEMHSHTRKSVFTFREGDLASKGLVEAGMGPERIMNFEAAKHFIDTASSVGAETMLLDAGWYLPAGKEIDKWYDGTGDWFPDEAKYGKDFAKIRDYAKSKGLLFGLWMEAESLGKESHTLKAHPEWAFKTFGGETARLIDMTNPEAALWVESEISRIVEEYKLDVFRLDFNVSRDYQFNRIDKYGKMCDSIAQYYKITCDMYRRLREKYPNVVFENCASGGQRTTLDFVKNFTHTWVTDWQIAPRSVAITNGMTMVLPPEKVDGLVGGMNSHTRGSLDFQARRCIFGRPTTNTYNCVGSEFNPLQIEFIKHTFDIYKEYVRPYTDTGKIYHHTPECYGSQPQGNVILERSSQDKKCGIIGIFSLCDANNEYVAVYPKGVDVSKNYQVTFDNSGSRVLLSGYEMLQNGIRVNLPTSLASELIIYQEA